MVQLRSMYSRKLKKIPTVCAVFSTTFLLAISKWYQQNQFRLPHNNKRTFILTRVKCPIGFPGLARTWWFEIDIKMYNYHIRHYSPWDKCNTISSLLIVLSRITVRSVYKIHVICVVNPQITDNFPHKRATSMEQRYYEQTKTAWVKMLEKHGHLLKNRYLLQWL